MSIERGGVSPGVILQDRNNRIYVTTTGVVDVGGVPMVAIVPAGWSTDCMPLVVDADSIDSDHIGAGRVYSPTKSVDASAVIGNLDRAMGHANLLREEAEEEIRFQQAAWVRIRDVQNLVSNHHADKKVGD